MVEQNTNIVYGFKRYDGGSKAFATMQDFIAACVGEDAKEKICFSDQAGLFYSSDYADGSGSFEIIGIDMRKYNELVTSIGVADLTKALDNLELRFAEAGLDISEFASIFGSPAIHIAIYEY